MTIGTPLLALEFQPCLPTTLTEPQRKRPALPADVLARIATLEKQPDLSALIEPLLG